MNSGSPSTPSSPYTLSTERYKANVNRTKTRKWVEAKKIDYGGDDWGADDDFDDDDDDDDDAKDQPPPMPQPLPQASRPDRLAGLRAIGDGSGSSTPRSGSAGSARSLRPSERIAMDRQGSGGLQQRNITAPPALHLQTGVQQQRPVPPAVEPQESLPATQSPYPPRKSSMSQQDRPDLTIDPAVQHPPRTSSRPTSPPGVRSPSSATGSTGPPRIIRPAEIYKRMEEEKDKERRSMDSARRSSLASSGDGEGPDASGNSARRPSFGNKNEGADGNRSLQALAPVAERKSEYGFDGLMINPGAPPPQQPQVSSDFATETARNIEPRQNPDASLSSVQGPPTLHYPQPQPASTVQAPGRELKNRYSTSPKLPDFTRLSGFGSDFFSSGGGFLGGSPKQSEAPAAEATSMGPATGSIPAGVTRTAEPTRHQAAEGKAAAQTDDQSAALSNTQPPPEPSQPKPFRPSLPGGWVSETPSSLGEMATPLESNSVANTRIPPPIGEHPEDLALKPAPLRTPTPRDRETFSNSTDEERASSRSGRTSPVKLPPLRTSPSPLANAEQSGQTAKNVTRAQQSSEATPVAVAPLQPRKSWVEPSTEEPPRAILRSDTVMTDTSSPLKESDVLRDEIIRSLSPVRGPTAHLDAQGGDGAGRESAYLSDVYGDYWAGGDKAEEAEHARNVGRTEPLSSTKEEGSASATPTPPAASEVDPVKPEMKRERFSWEAASEPPVPSPTKHPLPELPKDDEDPSIEEPQLASPVDSGRMSPLIPLPVLNFDRDDGVTTKGEPVSGGFPHGDDKNSGTLHSPTGDHDVSTSNNRGSELFSPSTEKMTLDSPTTPAGEGLTSLNPDPINTDSPTDIPLPRSPSLTKAGGSDNTPPTSSSQNTMNLKQIMALPTSPERVYKMHEARGEFATTPSGLEQWLTQLLAQPEHANGSPSFKYAPAGDDLLVFANQRRAHPATAAATAGGEGVSGPGRRSSVTLGGGIGSGGGVRIGSGATAAQLGNLMHGPAGAKGKELLQSAGKMGKGLLSKGKSKLRERAESKKG